MNWLIERLKASLWVSTQILTASLFINLLGLASSIYVIQVYTRYLVHGIDSTLITLSIGMLLVIVMEAALKHIRYRMAVALSAKPERLASDAIFNTMLHANADEVMNIKPGVRQMILRRNEQLQTARNPAMFVAMIDIPFVLIYLIAIFTISVSIGWWVLVLVIVMLAASGALALQIKNSTLAHMQAQMDQSEVSNSADRFEAVRGAGAAHFLQNKWHKTSAAVRWWKYRMGRKQEVLQSFVQSIAMLMTMIVIALGAREVVAGELNFGLLIGLNILAARALMMLAKPAQSIAAQLQASQSEAFIEKFLAIPQERKQGMTPHHFSGRLSLSNVAYAYKGGNGPVFEQLSVDIPVGSFVKVIGPNGAGKTTLCRLLTGLLNPGRGAILADGTDLRQIDLDWWRKQIVYLPQEPQFMDASVRQNITLLNPEIDPKTLSDIIEMAGLKRFIDRSQDGLEMMLKDGGQQISLGIRRRLALARAMIANGPIVIIDDPAEGLDSEGSQTIARLLNQYAKQQRTIFVMTHNTDAVKGKGLVIDLSHSPVPMVMEG